MPTPKSINEQATTKTKFETGAEGVSVYQGGTRDDVPEPPQDNRYMQLGKALLNYSSGPGLAMASRAVDRSRQAEHAAGEILGADLAAKDASLKNLNAAVADGRIPEGASPAFNFSVRASFLKLRGEQNQMRAREAYYADTGLRNTDDSDAFAQWASKWAVENEDAILKDTQGNKLYTDLEISHSNFKERIQDGLRALNQEHVAHRVSEREKLGVEVVSNLLATRMSSTLANMPSDQRDNKAIARMLMDVAYSSTTGPGAHGMDKSKISGLMQQAIVTKAMETLDPSYLDIANEIVTQVKPDGSPASILGNVAGFKEKAQQVREHVATQKYVMGQHAEQAAMQDIEAGQLTGPGYDGLSGLQKRAKYHGEAFAQTHHDFKKKQFIDTQTNLALNFKDITTLNPKEMDKQRAAIEAIRQVDPEAAVQTSLRILQAKDSMQTADNKIHFPLKEMELHNFILTAPGTPATNKAIDAALTDRAISGEQWLRLRALSDKEGQDKLKYAHILQDDAFKRLETAIGRAVNNSPGDPFGAAALHGGAAQLELRQKAVMIAKANPNMTPLDVALTLEPYMAPIAGKYNETMKEVLDNETALKKGQDAVAKEALRMSQPAAQKQQAEQVQKAEEQTKLIKEMDKAKKPVTPQTLDEAAKKDYDEKTFDTKLSTKNEDAYQAWKKKYAPKDSGADYDLRGAFKAGIKPDPKTGHWPDKFKKPNNPTFSDESRYAAFGKPGHWEGETFIPHKK